MERDGSNLILLFGRPRSGTTWVAKVFDSHPNVMYRHEPERLYPLVGVPLTVPEREMSRYFEAIRNYQSQLLSMSAPAVAAKLPLLPKRHFGPIRARLRYASALLGHAAARLSVPLPVYDPMRRRTGTSLKVVWKSVSGMGRLGAIIRALPACRAILIQRHPCGYVASQLRGLSEGRFGGIRTRRAPQSALPEALRLRAARSYGLTEESFAGMSAEERMAWRWVLIHESTFDQIEGQTNCTTVWYDDLCEAPVEGFQRLFEFAGLDWSDDTERFLKRTINNQDDGYYSIFKEPKRASTRWREELAPESIDRVLCVVRRSAVAARWFEDTPGH